MNTSLRPVRFLAALLLAAGLSACGGGSSDTPPVPPTAPPPASTSVVLLAQGSSARTVSLAWQPVAGASGYTLERSTGQGNYSPLVELSPQPRSHVDTNLAPLTAYRYRLTAHRDGSTLKAERETSTTADVPEATSC